MLWQTLEETVYNAMYIKINIMPFYMGWSGLDSSFSHHKVKHSNSSSSWGVVTWESLFLNAREKYPG